MNSTVAVFAELSWEAWLAIGVVVSAFFLSSLNRFPTDLVFLGALVVLFGTGVLDAGDALSGFSNAGMITVGTLYIVVTGLQQTGGLAWISERVLGVPTSLTRALTRLVAPIVGMSAFLNNTPVVAMFIPVVTDWARKLRLSPSKLLMPLSYAAIFGGTCTLIGTSTNLIVNGMLISELGHPGLRMFDITLVSLPCAVVGIAYLIFVSRWLLPDRKPAVSDEGDPREYTVEMIVEQGSPLAGQTIEHSGLRHLPGLFLTEVNRGGTVLPAVGPTEKLVEDDRLIFVGVVDSVVDLQKFRGLSPATDQLFKLESPRTERVLVEAVVSDTCPIVGRTIRDGRFRTRYNAVVLAVGRNAERLKRKIGDIVLRPGDILLLEAHPSFLDSRRLSRDFYLISGIPDSAPLRRDRAPLALLILVGMVIVAATGWTSMLKAAMVAAGLMIVTGCCTFSRARGNIQWHILLVIAAAIGIGRALDETGAAAAIAHVFIGAAGRNPWVILAAVYGVTTLLTEVITNNVAAVILFPIALAASRDLGVDFMPFAIVIMVAASASFATPIGYQTNLMVYGPGGYRFTDFMRVGVPLNLLYWAMACAIVPFVFPF